MDATMVAPVESVDLAVGLADGTAAAILVAGAVPATPVAGLVSRADGATDASGGHGPVVVLAASAAVATGLALVAGTAAVDATAGMAATGATIVETVAPTNAVLRESDLATEPGMEKRSAEVDKQRATLL